MEWTSVKQCLETPLSVKLGIDRLDDKWQCEGSERPFEIQKRNFTSQQRFLTTKEFINIFNNRFNIKTKDTKNEEFEIRTPYRIFGF